MTIFQADESLVDAVLIPLQAISMANTVRDNPQHHRFEMDLGDGLAVANYRELPGALAITPNSSRSHCTTAPAIKMLPSMA